MADEISNLVIEHLRAIRGELHEIRSEEREQRMRLGSIERGITGVASAIVQLGLHIDCMHDRLDRVEQRLGLVEA